MPINPPYRTDPCQNIVNFGFGGVFVAVAFDTFGNNYVLYSRGGSSWINLGNLGIDDIGGLVSPINPGVALSGAGTFVIISSINSIAQGCLSSTDGKNWTVTNPAGAGVFNLAYFPLDQVFGFETATGTVDGSPNSVFFLSPDGFAWTPFTMFPGDVAEWGEGPNNPPTVQNEPISADYVTVPGLTAIFSPTPTYDGVTETSPTTVPPSAWNPTAGGTNKYFYTGSMSTVISTDGQGNQTRVTCNGDNTVQVTTPDGANFSMNTASTGQPGLANTSIAAVSGGKFIVADANQSWVVISAGGPTQSTFAPWQFVDFSGDMTGLPSGTIIGYLAGQSPKKS